MFSSYFIIRTAIAALLAALLGPALVQASDPPTAPGSIPVAAFFRPAEYGQVALSPDGKTLAALAPLDGRPNLVTIDLAQRKPRILTTLKDGEVQRFWWLNDRRLLFDLVEHKRSTGQRVGYNGTVAIDLDGGRVRQLPWFWLQRTSVSLPPGVVERDEVIALLRDRSSYFDVHRLDTVTGRSTVSVFRTPGNVSAWHLDRDGFARAAETWDSRSLRWALHHRAHADSPWVKFREGAYLGDERQSIRIADFDYDGTMIVVANPNGDRRGLYWFDVEKNQLGPPLATHAHYDVEGGLIFDPVKRKLVGVRIEADKPEFHWIDDDWARWHAMIDRALPDRINNIVRTGPGLMLVHSYSDREPGTYYLFDPDTRRLEEVVRTRPWVDPAQMGRQQFLRYPARDGLPIPAYLTLPPGREPKNLPLVVLVHGGPFVRGERWGWDREAQFLASRGYAVLQADFRGSRGYGLRHYRAGWKQWGRAMQDDLNDGVAHLAAQGIVDPQRACIMGASYGGYAALMGVARDPQFWRCAISYAGVTDLELMVKIVYADYSGSRSAAAFHKQRVGDPSEDAEMFRTSSPLRMAANIKRPVLLATGSDDRRVPLENATRMRSALREHGVPHEWVMYDAEVHGFSIDDHAVDFYTRVERFLAQHLGPDPR